MTGEAKHDRSHAVVGRTFSTLWCHPVDVLSRIFDITCLTMDAVLRVDLQSTVARLVLDILVDA